MSASRFAWSVATALVVAAAGCVERPASSGAFRPLMVGDSAPAYAAATLVGDTVRVGGAASPPTLLNIWATWCESCREEFADLEQMRAEFAPRGVQVIAVSVDNGTAEVVRRFVDAQGTKFSVVHDPLGKVQDLYSPVGVPSTYIIAKGKVVWSLTGSLHKDTATVRREIRKALEGG